MEHQTNDRKKIPFRLSKRNLSVVIVVIILCISIVFLLTRTDRSIISFCRVAKEEKSILTGDVDYQKRLDSYRKLEAVSPDTIQSDITTIRKGYEVIVQDPSKALGAGFGMIAAENRRTAYIKENCPNF